MVGSLDEVPTDLAPEYELWVKSIGLGTDT
jgi:hypothetical protein